MDQPAQQDPRDLADRRAVVVGQEQQAQGVTAWLNEGHRNGRDKDDILCPHDGGDSPMFQVRGLFRLALQRGPARPLPRGRDGNGHLHRVEWRGVRRRPAHAQHESTPRDDSESEQAHEDRADAPHQ